MAGWIAIAAVTGMVLPVRVIMDPPTRPLERADAIVVFHGDYGERLDHAIELAERGFADVVVASTGAGGPWPGNVHCGQRDPVEIVCRLPRTASTRAEAAMFAAMARQRAWTEIIAVSSKEHVPRVRANLARCYDGRVTTAFVPRRGRLTLAAVLHEWLGLLDASTLRHWC